MIQLKRTRHLGMSNEDRDNRRSSIGGSDARILMSGDQQAIEKLWMEKRGEIEAEDLSEILIVQLGNVTEALNLDFFEHKTGYVVTNEQDKVYHPEWEHAHSTLDGLVRETEDGPVLGVLEAKFMLPFHWSLEKAIEKYYAQVQHNMMVNGQTKSWLSIICGASYYIGEVEADFFYQVALLQAEKDFWDCVVTGRTPGVPEVKANLPVLDEMRIVDMTTNNEWVDLALTILENKPIVDKVEKAEKDIKKLMPEDAREAFGRGVKISRSKDNKLRLTLDKKLIPKTEGDDEAAANDAGEEPKARKTRKKAA
jgi:predicted phage-related endonuclease